MSFSCRKCNNGIQFFYFPSLNIYIQYHQFVILLDNYYIIHFYAHGFFNMKSGYINFSKLFSRNYIKYCFSILLKYNVKIFPFKLQLILYDCYYVGAITPDRNGLIYIRPSSGTKESYELWQVLREMLVTFLGSDSSNNWSASGRLSLNC